MTDLLDRIIRLTPETVCCDWGSCLEIDEVKQLFAGRDSITLRDLLQEPVAPEHLLWLILRPEIIPEKHLHELGCRYAEYIIEALGVEPDPRGVSAIKAKRAWLAAIGTSQMAALEMEWEAAHEAAWEAAQETEWEAAHEAAWRAVLLDAREAAWNTASVAVLEVAWKTWEAAWEAALEMEWKKLLEITAEYLKGVSDG